MDWGIKVFLVDITLATHRTAPPDQFAFSLNYYNFSNCTIPPENRVISSAKSGARNLNILYTLVTETRALFYLPII